MIIAIYITAVISLSVGILIGWLGRKIKQVYTGE